MKELNRKDVAFMFVISSLVMGGSEMKTIGVANKLAERGRKVHLGVLDGNTEHIEGLDSRIPIIFFNRKRKIDTLLSRNLYEYVTEHNIECLWSVNLYPMLYLYLISRLHNKKKKLRLIGSSNVTEFNKLFHKIKVLLFILLIWKMDCFVFGSYRQMKSWKMKYLLGFKRGVSVIHNGVNIDRYSASNLGYSREELRNKYKIFEDEVVLGMVAQFRKEKAHKHCLQAIARLISKGYKIRLILVGEGPEKDDVERYAEELGIYDKIIFTGLMKDVREALVSIDIFTLTSVAVETFSNAALEAMAMGNPAVLSDLSGASEMIDDSINGFLYPPGDIDSLTCALEKLMCGSQRKLMGIAARKKVEDEFSLNRMVNMYEELIWT